MRPGCWWRPRWVRSRLIDNVGLFVADAAELVAAAEVAPATAVGVTA